MNINVKEKQKTEIYIICLGDWFTTRGGSI